MASRWIRGPITYTDVVVLTAAGNHSVTNAAAVIVRKAVGQATTVTLPVKPSASVFREVIVKDAKGDAATNAITINTPDGTLIDGQTQMTINSNYGSLRFFWDGTGWNSMANSWVSTTTTTTTTSTTTTTTSS